ncbi:probable transcription regulator [Lentisphaera araneosa HTCC2155]|jgi:AraC-like DNA-binding protein|uniref:Probable transcription regulator n=1 Tax=Lentisphaera araneosa HTCC2155 TaxID=313628 RepID=A6DJL6_9BACT|nr:helix-turn-helix domain-containing protein [Lentisphaera araneosa]EDM28090.1 probable transcription regulator [Lentisphaera araneosa HTCC2155]
MEVFESLNDCVISEDFFRVFDDIKGVLFFVKNRQCELIWANPRLAEHCGFSNVEDLVHAQDDFKIHSVEMAQQYREDDLQVMESGTSKEGIVELFPNYLGDLSWFVTKKIPLFNKECEVLGLYGIMQTYENSGKLGRPLGEISKALEYIKAHYTEKISNKTLARETGMSVRPFEKRFKEVFNSTPHQYIIKLRILKACDLLLSKNKSIIDVATEMGFYDQSAFNLHFKKQVGMTPLKYIKKHSS